MVALMHALQTHPMLDESIQHLWFLKILQYSAQMYTRHQRLQARAYPGIAWVISNHAYSYHENWTQNAA